MARAKKAPVKASNTEIIENPSNTAVIRLNNDITLFVGVDATNNVVNGYVLKNGESLPFTASLGE